ncbi:mechanosensitive ion channel family protein [Duganella sp. Leaf126]|uniref:mechanosensitive ion channel family protein n=1 Tax=Duganella sp. Leaf126 TaxID=1736266 RepID=UPI001E5B8F95|nr:mechanosensitive ion channel family protein [Duganella sp. Leaf126]
MSVAFAAAPKAADDKADTPADTLGRETPRSAVAGMIAALAELDYDRAALYFDIPEPANNRQQLAAATQARNFHALLDEKGSIKPFAALSNQESGKLDDELDADQEDVGEVTLKDKKIPILMTRSADGDPRVWRISRETLDQISAAARRVPLPAPPAKDDTLVGGAPLKDWATLVGLGVAIFGGLWIVSVLLVAAVRRMIADPAGSSPYRFFEAALPPFSLLVGVFVFYTWADQLPVSIVARQTLLRYTGIITAIALVWFGLRLVDGVADLAITRMQRHQRRQVVSVIILVRRAVKFLLLAFSVIAILDTFGIDVTTGIAALGIGGIALALGAQKTVENLVGSVTLIADRPLQVGDFVKVGDVVGTVEDVGIRSTRIRTGERTVVTVPNGDLSARQIENYADRDRFLFNPVIAIGYRTPSAKLREAISIVQQVIGGNANMAEGGRARLGNISDRAFHIETYAYINVKEFDTQVIIREELLLTIYERLEAAGIDLAFPTQTVVYADQHGHRDDQEQEQDRKAAGRQSPAGAGGA